MAVDLDRLAITRKRKREGRCVACGVRSGHAVLCPVCGPLLNWCAACETTRPRTCKRTTSLCPPCDRARGRFAHQPRARYLDSERAKRHPKLNTVIRLYRDGLSHTDMAAALHLNMRTLGKIIHVARRKGQWPAQLKRYNRRIPQKKAST